METANTIYSGQYKSVGNSLCLNDVTQSFNETISTELEAGTYYICLKRNSNNVYRTGNYSISFNSDVVISPESIKLNKTSAEIEKGSTLTLTATVYPADVTDKTVTWTTSNSKVATVSQGKVKAVSAGTTTITAKTANGKKASCKVTVQDEILKNSSNVSATSITLGNAFKVTCASTGGTGTKTYAVWYKQSSSSEWTQVQNYNTNTSVSFTPAKAGNYDVSVKVKDGAGTVAKKAFIIKVNEKLANTSKISSATINLGDTIKIKCSATGSSGFYKYAVYYKKDSSSSWSTASSFSSTASVKVTPKYASGYTIRTKVKDTVTGKVVSKEIKLTVNA